MAMVMQGTFLVKMDLYNFCLNLFSMPYHTITLPVNVLAIQITRLPEFFITFHAVSIYIF